MAVAAPSAPAQTPVGPDETPVEIVVTSDWDRILRLYQQVHGGPERLAELQYISFDFTPSVFDKEGKETVFPKKKVEIRFRNQLPYDTGEDGMTELLLRSVRVESEMDISDGKGEDKIKMITIVTPKSSKVWLANSSGGYDQNNAKELRLDASYDANAILAHLDMILMPESEELLFRYVGVRQRDGVKYAAVEAEFTPERGIRQLYRNYFSPVTSLIERMDIYDPETKRRMGFTRVTDYEDHGGIKFPRKFKTFDKKEKPIGTWTFSNVKVNPTFDPAHFEKP
jgi:hypothetical protein